MRNNKIFNKLALLVTVFMVSSCSDFLDVNTSPNSISDAPIEQLLTSATTSVGFLAGSDLNRYSSIFAQHYSGQGSGATTQMQEYDRYNVAGSDVNNVWNLIYSTGLSDIELMIKKGESSGSPHYTGVGKIMKVYLYQLLVDSWGKVPYSEALQFANNTKPKFDDGAEIYPKLLTLLDEAIVNVKATVSTKSPGTNSTFYSGTFAGAAGSGAKWVRFANALKMRILMRYLEVDKTKAVADITSLISSTTAADLMSSNADNFEMAFFNVPRNQNAMHQFLNDRADQLYPGSFIVNLMNGKTDPRRKLYFTPFPFVFGSSNFKGATSGDPASIKYSRFHTYLRGDTLKTAAPINADGSINSSSYTYTGAARTRLLTYAEYCFMRAEAAAHGAPGVAETWYQDGIKASMSMAGVSTAEANAYIAANGTLPAATSDKIKAIIEEKYVANFGVIGESWSDWRRTGYPSITKAPNAVTTDIPRSLFYPQSEIDLNPNAPGQKPSDLQERVFWDK